MLPEIGSDFIDKLLVQVDAKHLDDLKKDAKCEDAKS
jgi:hypothetical protein